MIRAAVISGLLALPAIALPAHAENFLSLAMDQGAGVYGFGRADAARDAQVQAMQVCSEMAGECKVLVTRANTCMSLAYDYSNGGFGVSTDPVAETAQQQAVPLCTSYGNPNCQIVETVCAQ